MSSLVLLNKEGVIVRKLQLVSLPDDYVMPEGTMISWRMDMQVSSSIPRSSFHRLEPVEAYFYLGGARGQVCRGEVKDEWDDRIGSIHYGSRTLTITVQGTSAKDVIVLRDRIMHLINSDARWEVSNDLNPKPKRGFLQRLKKMVGR